MTENENSIPMGHYIECFVDEAEIDYIGLWQVVDAAKEAVLRDNLRTTREVIDKFHADLGRYPESLGELVERNYLRALPHDPLTASSETWRLLPVPEGYRGVVYDLRSGAAGQGQDGSRFADW